MIFAPVRLGETSLNAEAVAADKKSCKRFGPCGVGKEALFLNSYFIDRRYYVAFSSVRRVFKRVAMSQGGFSGKGVFGAIPYLVVQYDGGKEKQCTFKREEDVDAMLAYIGEVHPEIPTLSVGGEQRLEQKAKEEAARYLSELTSDAQSAKEELEKAQKFLSGYPELTDRLSKAARAKRVNQHTNPAYRWVALAIVLAGAAALVYGIISWRGGSDFGVYFALFGFAAVFDCFDSSVLGLAMETNMKATLCEHTLDNAYLAHPDLRGAIVHSDRGRQYTSETYRQALSKYGIIQSMNSDGGRCHDNARCESMWARMKSELLYDRYNTESLTTDELRVLIWRYFISYWNNRRICSANGGLPPMIKRQRYYQSLGLAA